VSVFLCVCESVIFCERERMCVVFEHNTITILLPLILDRSQIRNMLGGETGKVHDKNRVKIWDLQ